MRRAPSPAGPRLACSAQPLPGPACLSRAHSPKMSLCRPSVPATLSTPMGVLCSLGSDRTVWSKLNRATAEFKSSCE